MEWVKLAIEIGVALARVVMEAVAQGDMSVLDKPVRDVLPAELRTTLARRTAEAEAAAKFSVTPTAPTLDALLADPVLRLGLRVRGWTAPPILMPAREDEDTRETKAPR